MNRELSDMLLAGLSRFNTDLVVAQVGTDQESFDNLVDIMLTAPEPIPLRAAWAISVITDKDPWLLEPRIVEIFDKRNSFKHPSVIRFLLRYLTHAPVPEDRIGEVFDFCYSALQNVKNPAAIRVFAMQVLYNISEIEPDLKNELALLIEAQLDTGSAGVINRGEKLLKKLKKEASPRPSPKEREKNSKI